MRDFHRCLSLIEDPELNDEVLDPSAEEKYTQVRFRYSDVTDYMEWVEEDIVGNEEVKGTLVFTILGRQYLIKTPLDEFDRLMDEHEEDSKSHWISKVN